MEDVVSGKLRLGVSRCLLGEKVRYDGGHQLDRFVAHILGDHVEYVSVCPEVECGMSIPREAVRLAGDVERPRLVGRESGRDYTEQMENWAARRLEALAGEGLSGFIFKSGSPSSGMERIKVYPASGAGQPVSYKGVGVFARMFMERFPRLPVEDDGRLHDMRLRENFIERIFVVRRWQDVLARPSQRALVDFHTRHKLLVLSHNTELYRELGRLVAGGKARAEAELFDLYEELLMRALRLLATPRKHANVLTHCLGYFKKRLTPDEKQEMLELIARHRTEQVPLIVPLILLNHYVRKYGEPYLADQVYLNPHPAELKLRNHV
jgi:uncharacterized protein YbgA (DUF1722 family)/uncharacterized protein YbbK (DUF523 family)